jgi:pyridoxamine 5'-phosphate oxidase
MSDDRDLGALRREFRRAGLSEGDVHPDPLVQFAAWLDEAAAAGVPDLNAMTLATADAEGVPSARTVLLKGLSGAGFTFFTSHASRKGRELAANPRAALVFAWLPLERQVCAAGPVTPVSDEESDAYFAARPLGARISAWASQQSRVVADREALEAAFAEVASRVVDGHVERPPHWGGYRLVPERVELWQGRPDRLHDRLQYRREGGGWVLERLGP